MFTLDDLDWSVLGLLAYASLIFHIADHFQLRNEAWKGMLSLYLDTDENYKLFHYSAYFCYYL